MQAMKESKFLTRIAGIEGSIHGQEGTLGMEPVPTDLDIPRMVCFTHQEMLIINGREFVSTLPKAQSSRIGFALGLPWPKQNPAI
jgi:hypothetical protein